MSTRKKQPATKPQGRPARVDKNNATASPAERGTLPGEKRKTYIVNSGTAGKIEAIAYWDRKNIKLVVSEAFGNYITSWEKKNGTAKPPPSR